MRFISTAILLMACTGLAHAGLGDTLRELRGTIGEITNTNKAAGDLFKSISTVTDGQVDKSASLPKEAESSVILYRTSYCGYCKQAASYMQQKSIPFIEKDIEDATNQAEYKALGGGKGVPFMVFGKKTMSGFSTAGIDKNYAEFQSAKASNTESGTTANTSGFQSGDVLVPKLDKIKVLKESDKKSAKLITASKNDQLVFMGEEQNGMYRVTTTEGEGWVDKLLVKKP